MKILFTLGSIALAVLVLLERKPKDLTWKGQYRDRYVERPSVTRNLAKTDDDITQDDLAW